MNFLTKIRGFKEVWQFDNRLRLIVSKLFFPGEQLQIYHFKGMDILTDHAAGDANGAREVLTSPMYRRFFPQMNFSGAINVLDLGANNGGFPLLLQACGIRLKKVVSVELNPKTFTRLRFNLERNLNCTVVALNAALCGQNETLKVSLGAGSVADSIYQKSAEANASEYEIEGLTADEFVRRYYAEETIDLCKIDVEGAEFDVFLQPAHESLRRCRYLIMEIHERDGRRAEEILPAVARLGFARQPTAPDADPSVHFFVNSALK
ncbi:MAG: FkbM family methyltransferase [Acidobacteriota bacterium]|nr:FkbM family methyltransferase [Acidobacteriota bacterium]